MTNLSPTSRREQHLARHKKRKKAATRFRIYGILALCFASLMLVVLIGSIVERGWKGFLKTEIQLPIEITVSRPDSSHLSLHYLEKAFTVMMGKGYSPAALRDGLKLLSIDAQRQIKNHILHVEERHVAMANPRVTAADAVDLWMKGTLSGEALLSSGRLSDTQLRWLKDWKEQGKIHLTFNTDFFTSGDSREPELAGFAASLIGSLLTVFSCLLIAFPLGVMTAIYLEEFAPKNRLNDFIEVNINNLAAVPSIVFGLLGLALYLSVFGMPRSAALVGGMTLALLILPVIIIATRASLRAVPSSIRDAARGLGATELQVVLHHSLPLALPGIMTGTILGIARALGETAPLLMIGMVAFIADIPQGLTDPTTAMPVQIYLWASSPELGFVEKTSAGIMVLLAVLLLLNYTAVKLRNKFEKRW